jgi:hypothetical protein
MSGAVARRFVAFPMALCEWRRSTIESRRHRLGGVVSAPASPTRHLLARSTKRTGTARQPDDRTILPRRTDALVWPTGCQHRPNARLPIGSGRRRRKYHARHLTPRSCSSHSLCPSALPPNVLAGIARGQPTVTGGRERPAGGPSGRSGGGLPLRTGGETLPAPLAGGPPYGP